MNRPDEIDKCRDNLRRPGYVDAGTCRITSEGLSEILDWIDHLEANQVQVVRADEVVPGQSVLHEGQWRQVTRASPDGADHGIGTIFTFLGNPKQVYPSESLLAVRPKQKQCAEDIIRKVLEHPTPVAEQHAKKAAAYEIVSALREAGLLHEVGE